MQEQLDIFSTEPEPIKAQQAVRIYDIVKVRTAVDTDDVETYYYLQEYEGRTGQVVKRTSTRLNQYEVAFKGLSRNAILNASEILPVN